MAEGLAAGSMPCNSAHRYLGGRAAARRFCAGVRGQSRAVAICSSSTEPAGPVRDCRSRSIPCTASCRREGPERATPASHCATCRRGFVRFASVGESGCRSALSRFGRHLDRTGVFLQSAFVETGCRKPGCLGARLFSAVTIAAHGAGVAPVCAGIVRIPLSRCRRIPNHPGAA